MNSVASPSSGIASSSPTVASQLPPSVASSVSPYSTSLDELRRMFREADPIGEMRRAIEGGR